MWFEKFFSSHTELIFEKIGPHLKINGALRRHWELDWNYHENCYKRLCD
jgi:hypothetical protein